MTVDEFRPLAMRLGHGGLVAWPTLPSGAPSWMRSKLEEWARALDDLPAAEVEAAVDSLVKSEREPIRHPGAVRARVMRARAENGAAPKPFSSKGRSYSCACCVDTGCVSGRVRCDDGREYPMLFPCRCDAGKSIALAAKPLPDTVTVVAAYQTLHGDVDQTHGNGAPCDAGRQNVS